MAAPATPREAAPQPELEAADITRWWEHIDREAGEPSPHYGRHFCHYQQQPVSSIAHGLASHEAAACMQDMAERLGLTGEVQSKGACHGSQSVMPTCPARDCGNRP